ncbi:hypothetical protein ABZ639_06675 [Saccharomonospora sp. NPDC006951]
MNRARGVRIDRADLPGHAGYLADASRLPPPPGLPTLRAFQRTHADALLPWPRELLGD